MMDPSSRSGLPSEMVDILFAKCRPNGNSLVDRHCHVLEYAESFTQELDCAVIVFAGTTQLSCVGKGGKVPSISSMFNGMASRIGLGVGLPVVILISCQPENFSIAARGYRERG